MAGLPKNNNKESDAAIYEAVGRYISHWEALETALAVLYGALIGGSWPQIVTSYSTVFGIFNRLNMINAALASAYDTKIGTGKKITKLISDIRQESSFRNEIAHGQVHFVKKGETHQGRKIQVDKGYFLCAPSYNTGRWKLGDWSDYHHTAKHIMRHVEICRAFRDQLYDDLFQKALRHQVQTLKPVLRGVPLPNL